MFSDTVTITVNSVAKVLTRINQDKYSSEYLLRETDGDYKLRLRHTSYTDKNRPGKVIDRHNVEFVQTVYATSSAAKIERKAYVVLENENSDGVTAPLNFDLGFTAFFSSANITKLLNWES